MDVARAACDAIIWSRAMGELIHIREILREREIARSRARDRDSLERALEVFKQNLQWVAADIAEAPASEQPELLARAENLVSMIRYGVRMLGHESEPEPKSFSRNR
jgi:hypothetical protein